MPIQFTRSESLHLCARQLTDMLNTPECDLRSAACQLSHLVRKFSGVLEGNHPEFVQLVNVMDFLGQQISAQTGQALEHHVALISDYIDAHGDFPPDANSTDYSHAHSGVTKV